jgi:hypothetical protein
MPSSEGRAENSVENSDEIASRERPGGRKPH